MGPFPITDPPLHRVVKKKGSGSGHSISHIPGRMRETKETPESVLGVSCASGAKAPLCQMMCLGNHSWSPGRGRRRERREGGGEEREEGQRGNGVSRRRGSLEGSFWLQGLW